MTGTLVGLFTAISALGGLGGLAAFAYVTATRRKINAEAKKLDVDADVLMSDRALEMYDRVTREAKDLRSQVGGCLARQSALEEHVRLLEDELRTHGIKPPPFRWPVLEIAKPSDEQPGTGTE